MWTLGFRSALYPLANANFAMDLSSLLMTVVIGLCAGLAGWIVIKCIARSKVLFSRVASLPLRLGAGGFAVGLLALISTDILGNGYEVIIKVMAGHYLLPGLLLLLVLKTLATSLSVGSNAVGGLFTPSLLIGALLGGDHRDGGGRRCICRSAMCCSMPRLVWRRCWQQSVRRR
nr:chloride channel protein [Pantoea sp. 1B4]